jgi:putative MATE family efflux protein
MDIQPKQSRLKDFIAEPEKSLWKLSFPMMMGMSVQAIYMLVDTAFIGKWVGSTALAAMGYVFPFLFILMGITFGLGSGATTVIAQYIGAENKKNADNTAEHVILLGFVITLMIFIFGFFYGESFLLSQGADLLTTQTALEYFYIMVGGSFFMIMSVFFRSILSGEGDNVFPMKVLGVGTVLNIILDPIFIHYYQIQGAAIATVISQLIVFSVFTYTMVFKDHAYITLSIKNFSFKPFILKEIFRLGLPASLSMLIMSMGVFIFNIILNSSDAVAGYQTAGRIEHLFFLPIISIATSLVTLVGMFHGAKRYDLVNNIIKYGLSRAVIISIIFSALFYFYIDMIIPVFTDSQQIMKISISYFKIMAFAYPFVTIGMTSSRIMQGLGYANPMFVLTLFRVVLISAPLSWYIMYVLHQPIHYVWFGPLTSSIIAPMVSVFWLFKILRGFK